MDSFTESILSRARQRANLLTKRQGGKNEAESEIIQSKVLSEKNLSEEPVAEPTSIKDKCLEDSLRSSPQKTKTLCFQKENLNMEIKVTSSEDVRVEVEFEECSDSEEKNNKGAGLRKDVKDRLNRLGKLYAGGEDAELSSPIHRTEEKFMSEVKSNDTPITDKHGKKLIKGLANLAEEMNRWEDEVKKCTKSESSSLKWDKSVLDSLESQGFQRKPKESKLVYNYTKNEGKVEVKNNSFNKYEINDNKVGNSKQFRKESPVRKVDEPKSYRTEMNQKKIVSQDPSSLSISERKALFEKNQGQVLLPKAPFGMPIPMNSDKGKMSSTNKVTATNNTNASIQSPRKEDKGNKKNVTLEHIALKKVASNDNFSKNDSNNEDRAKPTIKSVTKKTTSTIPCHSKTENASTPSRTINECSKVVAQTKQLNSCAINANESSAKVATPCSGGIAHTVEALFKTKSTISQEQIQSQIKEQRMKEMQMLLNRFKKKEIQNDIIQEEDEPVEENSSEGYPSVGKENEQKVDVVEQESDCDENDESPPLIQINDETSNVSPSPRRSGGKRSSVSPRVAAVLEDVKRIKVSPVKPGRIYPSLSDIEATKDTETEDGFEDSSPENSSIASYSGTLETSFGKEILEAVCKNHTPVKRGIYDDSTASDVSDVLGDMDDYLDEALEDEDKECMGPTPPKQTKSKDSSFASHSFNYKDFSPSVANFKSPIKRKESPEKRNEKAVQPPEDDGMVPLAYTVSFYRKQTNNVASPSPMKVVTRQEADSTPGPDRQQEILEKIKSLQTEVQKLQLIIAQTSQALNLCNNTLEFMGSTEQVEAEKLLLVSTHRRQAILNEIQRLKVEGTLRPQNHNGQEIPIENGVLTISDITLPLKKDYVRALAAAGGKGHHVICLVKCGEEVVSTKLVSTVASNMKNPCYELTIPGSVSLKNIYNDSTVTLEVYCLQAQEEYLPHDVKYHIKKNKATPKKSKHESLLSRPIKESPGGPQAVRSPSFALMGYVVFSVYKINRKSWSLNNTPSMSPLEGSVEMNASCELTANVEYRGFLTMFEDISGFGAWHRRWCLLKGNALSYWKYPDDEKKMPPINSIDLSNCITREVGPVSRDICARLHTFLIETERDPLPQDKETLTTICKKDKTIIRHLLSADTKEERIQWCSQFNTILLAKKICGNA